MTLPRIRPAALLLAFVVSAPALYGGFVADRITEDAAVERFIIAVLVCQALTSFLLGVLTGYQRQNALAAEDRER